jgi:uncharacterized iron-regulated membrane protein
VRWRFHIANRKTHAWLAIVLSLPFLVIAGTGILLQLKKQLPWVQPRELRGAGGDPLLSLPRVLEICRSVPEAAVAGWADVRRIDVRPDRGILKVWTLNNREIQIDTATGAVLQVAVRRSDLIESIHDGSWFGTPVKFSIFLPTAAVLLILVLTGWYMFLLPYRVRRRVRKARES